MPFSTEIFPFSVSNQPAIFEAISNPDQLTSLLQSSNSLVTKYIAKSIAYLSLRNGKLYGIDWNCGHILTDPLLPPDKYKSLLLQGNGASILVQKLQVASVDPRAAQVDKASEETNSDQIIDLETSMVTNLICAVANFATNGKINTAVMN